MYGYLPIADTLIILRASNGGRFNIILPIKAVASLGMYNNVIFISCLG
jgi:hypothetical protein